jgi:hypothetical protein
MTMTRLAGAAALAGVLAAAAPALGAQCLDTSFPDSAMVGGQTLVLNGMGIRKATVFEVKVYVAGLYLVSKSADPQQIANANQPWSIVVHVMRDVSADDLRKASDQGFARVAGGGLGALQDRIDALDAQMTDLKDGEVMSYDYDPTSGTVLTIDGRAGKAIEGADFASTLLLALIGPSQPDQDLRAGLLGGACK